MPGPADARHLECRLVRLARLAEEVRFTGISYLWRGVPGNAQALERRLRELVELCHEVDRDLRAAMAGRHDTAGSATLVKIALYVLLAMVTVTASAYVAHWYL